MKSVLAIDAAWTAGEPSGVALVSQTNAGRWRCCIAAPSYGDFLDGCRNGNVNWAAPVLSSGEANLPALLKACNGLTGHNPTVIALDMPVSRQPIHARRTADNAVSAAFGGQGCSTHTPSTIRPGPLGSRFSNAAAAEGYPIATTQPLGADRHLVEVYPHIALLRLLGTNYRTPYKVSKSGKYWPGRAIPQRIALLLAQFQQILGALGNQIANIVLPLPAANNVGTLSGLKRYEDALDALVSAWVGIKYLEQQAIPFGDLHAAIWNAQ